MAVQLKYNKSIAKMAEQYASGEFLGVASKLTLGIVLMRSGIVVKRANGSRDGDGWKGVTVAAKLPEIVNNNVTVSDISKATKVVDHFLPDALLVDDAEVVDLVLAFTAEHGSMYEAYEAYQTATGKGAGKAGTASKVWTLEQAALTLAKSARSNSVDPHAVVEAVEAAIKTVWG